jgi:hypothetical protein
MSDYIAHDHQHDGIDRRGFLKCMAWAGTGVVFGVVGDRVVTTALADVVQGKAAAPAATFSFVQISDSHIGFHKAPNKNVIGTFEEAVRRINALPQRPAFVMHTGDHVHLSTMGEFDTVKQIMGTIKTDRTFNERAKAESGRRDAVEAQQQTHRAAVVHHAGTRADRPPPGYPVGSRITTGMVRAVFVWYSS